MEINLTTPAVLFPAVSLILLAYTNRFMALAAVIRRLHGEHLGKPDPRHLAQIVNLRKRIRLVRSMQFCGVLSLLLCTACMFLLFCGLIIAAEIIFSMGLVSMIYSLVLSLIEIQISVHALDLLLQDIEQPGTSRG